MIVHGRRAHAVRAVAEAISAEGGQAEGLTADLADPGDCARLISRALAGGDIDILVNNAGAFANRGWDDAAPEDWLALYVTNVAAVVRCIQGFLPAMRAAGWGRIVQIGTGEAVNPFPIMPDYRRPRLRCLTSRPRWPSTWTAPASRSHGQSRHCRHAWRTGVLPP